MIFLAQSDIANISPNKIGRKIFLMDSAEWNTANLFASKMLNNWQGSFSAPMTMPKAHGIACFGKSW